MVRRPLNATPRIRHDQEVDLTLAHLGGRRARETPLQLRERSMRISLRAAKPPGPGTRHTCASAVRGSVDCEAPRTQRAADLVQLGRLPALARRDRWCIGIVRRLKRGVHPGDSGPPSETPRPRVDSPPHTHTRVIISGPQPHLIDLLSRILSVGRFLTSPDAGRAHRQIRLT